MSRCFISYRHVSPDQELARALADFLAARNHGIFLDTKIGVGTRWVDEIERELRAANYFIVLLSEQSLRSDMVRQEVALAHELAAQAKLRILPIRVAYVDRLPYDLAAYLNPLQHCFWNNGEPFEGVCAEIGAAIEGQSLQNAMVIQFESESLDRLSKELAAYVGPMARVLVNRAAKGAQSWNQLYDSLAEEVPAGHERQQFLAKRTLR
jgi:hypothetical protein